MITGPQSQPEYRAPQYWYEVAEPLIGPAFDNPSLNHAALFGTIQAAAPEAIEARHGPYMLVLRAMVHLSSMGQDPTSLVRPDVQDNLRRLTVESNPQAMTIAGLIARARGELAAIKAKDAKEGRYQLGFEYRLQRSIPEAAPPAEVAAPAPNERTTQPAPAAKPAAPAKQQPSVKPAPARPAASRPPKPAPKVTPPPKPATVPIVEPPEAPAERPKLLAGEARQEYADISALPGLYLADRLERGYSVGYNIRGTLSQVPAPVLIAVASYHPLLFRGEAVTRSLFVNPDGEIMATTRDDARIISGIAGARDVRAVPTGWPVLCEVAQALNIKDRDTQLFVGLLKYAFAEEHFKDVTMRSTSPQKQLRVRHGLAYDKGTISDATLTFCSPRLATELMENSKLIGKLKEEIKARRLPKRTANKRPA